MEHTRMNIFPQQPRSPAQDKLPSVFNDSKQTGWRRGQLHLNAPGDGQRFIHYGNKNHNFKPYRTFHETDVVNPQARTSEEAEPRLLGRGFATHKASLYKINAPDYQKKFYTQTMNKLETP